MPPVVNADNQLYDFDYIRDPLLFESPGFTKALYTIKIDELWRTRVRGQVIDERGNPITVNFKLYQWSLFRLLRLQLALCRHYEGYDGIIRMLLASAIAQEPVLFIGKPGVGKTGVALSFYSGIGLRKPMQDDHQRQGHAPAVERNKYFEYILQPFTVPEELFGTMNFKELEKGTVTRINTNMATGKLVRGIFLDEVFNANSNILNTLLMLINERRYFDKGMFQEADLKLFIGASNFTPVSRARGGDSSAGNISIDLQAFYDRFTIRLYFPTPQEKYGDLPSVKEAYKRIYDISKERFMEKITLSTPKSFEQIACINDVLLLGRVLSKVVFPPKVQDVKLSIVASLALQREGRSLCYMSPRKPNKMLPIILADSLLTDTEKIGRDVSVADLVEIVNQDFNAPEVSRENLKVFHHIWDFEGDRDDLANEINLLLEVE